MAQFDNYLDDPHFMKWIFQPDMLSEVYWEKYIQEHPEEKKAILSLKKDLHTLKLKNNDLNEQEKRILFETIVDKKEFTRINTKKKDFRIKILSYAAVAIMFLLIGNMIMFFMMKRNQPIIDYTAMEYNQPVEQPKIFFSNGTDIDLEQNSTIEYSSQNKVIVNEQAIDLPTSSGAESIINQIVIPSGSRSVITLNDSTVVYLNAGSKLIYPSVFTEKKREVILFGEAFFKVHRNTEYPFVVRTSALTVEVLGTSFNLSSYAEDNVIQTVLVEGKVAIRRNDAPFYERSTIVYPSELVSFHKKTHKIRTRSVDTEYYTLWKDGILKFENEDFSRIIKKLERFYDLRLQFDDPMKGTINISGKLDLGENKLEVFQYLSTLTKMKFEQINENSYVIK